MSNLYWLAKAQMARFQPFLPKRHGKPRIDDRRVPRGTIFINLNGLRWRDAPREYGPPKTLYSFKRAVILAFLAHFSSRQSPHWPEVKNGEITDDWNSADPVSLAGARSSHALNERSWPLGCHPIR